MADNYSELMKPWLAGDECEDPAQRPSAAEGPADSLPIQYNAIVLAHRTMIAQLQEQLLAHIHCQPFGFFEELIIDVALAVGYAGRRRDLARKIGRSGDGGVDGIIELDELGLDAIYLQAKRLKPSSSVSSSSVRDFIGSLETKRATKGIFVTTGNFTASARAVVGDVSKRVALINGRQLTDLMIRHLIGIKVTESFQFKQIDISYFQKRMASGAASPSAI